MRRAVLFAMAAGLAFGGADKSLPLEDTSNESIEISGRLIVGKDQVQQALGIASLPDTLSSLVVVSVKVRPLADQPLPIGLDDFFLLCTKDGQRSQPFEAAQLAGGGTMVIHRAPGTGGATHAGPVWNGIPGLGSPGVGVGGSAAPEVATATVEAGKDDKADPLEAALAAKILPEKKTMDTISGLLYFLIDGKFKTKDLELHYRGPAGKLAMRFPEK